MIMTLVCIYLGMAAMQFLWSLIVYAKLGRSEECKNSYRQGVQKACNERFGVDYDDSIPELNKFLRRGYWIGLIYVCIKQGLEWPREVFYAIKDEIKGS